MKGKSSLKFIEVEELGDVKGKSMLHLQCHFGQDSLSWARMGAKVTGVDFSDQAISTANLLRDELKLDAKFICSNVYDLQSKLDQKFDIVFTSYGTIGWLPDLSKWGKLISHYLKPGGTFHIVEFHTFVWMFDDDFTEFKYSYFNQGEIEEVVEKEVSDSDELESESINDYDSETTELNEDEKTDVAETDIENDEIKEESDFVIDNESNSDMNENTERDEDTSDDLTVEVNSGDESQVENNNQDFVEANETDDTEVEDKNEIIDEDNMVMKENNEKESDQVLDIEI